MKYLHKAFLLSLLFYSSIFAKENLEPVAIQLQWKHQFEFAGFYMAKEKGYYKKAGLDVSFLEYSAKSPIVKTVLDKKASYGVGYSSILVDYYKGKPIVILANYFKHSPLVLVTQKEIQTLDDLRGKTIMGLSDGIDNINLAGMLTKFGLTSNDYKSIPSDFKIDKFVHKRVDAMSVYITNEPYMLNTLGVKYNIFNPTTYGLDYYDVNLFTTKNEILKHPKRVYALTKATNHGWKYALSHQEEAIALIMKKYNTQHKSKKALEFEAKQIESIMLPKIYPIGMIDKVRLQKMVESFKESGFIDKNSYKDLDKFIFTDNVDVASEWYIVHLIKYVYNKWVWQFIGLLGIAILFLLWRSYHIKKLNKGLHNKIEEVVSNNDKLEKLALYDNITKLPNRTLFLIELEKEIKRASRNSQKIALLFIDLDGFKSVNDTYGHQIGDDLLQHVADTFSSNIRGTDTVARIGGDEFVIILPNINEAKDAVNLASNLIDKISKPINIKDNKIKIGASIGVSIYPEHTQDVNELIKIADSMMYESKEAGKNRVTLYTL